MAGTVISDVITTNALPDAMRLIYSNELEFTSRPNLIYDQPAWVEPRDEFGAKRGQQVTWTIYHQLPPAIRPLAENQDIDGGGIQDHQVSFTIQEYGDAIGTTELLDLTSYHGPISNIVRTLLAPSQSLTMDTICRNMYWYAPNRALLDSSKVGPRFKSYVGGVSSRAALNTSTSIMTAEVAKAAAYRMTVRRVPTMSGQDPSYICLTHPSVTYDLKSDPYWKDAQLYSGSTRIYNGEEGMIHGMRFLKSDRARIANGGSLTAQSTLAANYNQGSNSVVVAAVTGFTVGQEVTIHHTGVSTTATIGGTPTTWTAPDGTDPSTEELVITAINTGTKTITFDQKTLITHASGDYITEAQDVYPMIILGGLSAMGKGVVVPPEIRVSLPTDKLRRMSFVGWYGLFGFGITRDWAYELIETLATMNTPPVYSF